MPRPARRPTRRPDRHQTPGGGPQPPPEEAASAPRIIGGELRHRRLAHQPDGRTRPMKDRVRESLFDLLGTDVRGALAIDLFAGTGALGFEALSRGATRAVFVERHFPTADVLRRSAKGLDVEAHCDIRSGDVLLWGKRMPELSRDLHWIVFVSPPWAFFAEGHERRGDLLGLIDSLRLAAPPRSTIVVEADTEFDGAALPDAEAWERRPIPPAVLYLYRMA
ncbi:MAG: RsmD family RNA methyltransferase [Planctomycetia bacterium]|nr:RsmD family RNA methyltransferase [Planctomycetia bacterium]